MSVKYGGRAEGATRLEVSVMQPLAKTKEAEWREVDLRHLDEEK
jgi:hypothetical protein